MLFGCYFMKIWNISMFLSITKQSHWSSKWRAFFMGANIQKTNTTNSKRTNGKFIMIVLHQVDWSCFYLGYRTIKPVKNKAFFVLYCFIFVVVVVFCFCSYLPKQMWKVHESNRAISTKNEKRKTRKKTHQSISLIYSFYSTQFPFYFMGFCFKFSFFFIRSSIHRTCKRTFYFV